MRYQERENSPPEPPFPGQPEFTERPEWPSESAPSRSSFLAPDSQRPYVRPAPTAARKPPSGPPAPKPADEAAQRNRTLIGFVLCLISLIIGLAALKLSPAAKVGPYGLIQAISPLYYVAIILLLMSFTWNLRVERYRSALLGTHLALLVFLAHGAPAVIESAARFETAYIHVSFTDYIANSGSLLSYYDARFSWPSFFEAVAMLDKVAGVNSSEVLLRWWPVAMNLLYLPFIYGIAKQLLRSERRAWVAAALFPLADWVGQDYFSPQSVAYLLYLAFVYVLVVPLGARDRAVWQVLWSGRPGDAGGQTRLTTPARRDQSRITGLGFYLAALVLLIAAIATGHQLTPFMAIGSAVVLVIAGRTQARGIVLVSILITIGWICYGAVAFWSGHINLLIGGVGNVGGNVGSGVTQRVTGNPYHQRIVDVRLLTAVFVWGLALLGALVWRPKNGDRAAVLLLFFTAFAMIAGGNYGGEGVLRVYLFSIPGAVCLIAALISSLPRFWHGQLALSCVLLLLIPLFLLSRWGNELYEEARPGELTATSELYQIAAPGSNIVILNSFVVWRYYRPDDIIEYQTNSPVLTTLGPKAVPEITSAVAGDPKGGYVIITADQEYYGWLNDGLPENWGSTVEALLKKSPDYTLKYSNADAEIFQYTPQPTAAKPHGKKKS